LEVCCVGDTVKLLKPYHIKADTNHLYVIVSPENFALLINGEHYQFVPYKEKQIMVNRKTKKIANPGVEFSFQKGGQIIYISMKQLMRLVDFLHLLKPITKPFYVEGEEEVHLDVNESEIIIGELDRLNIKRLIDPPSKSIDSRFNTPHCLITIQPQFLISFTIH